MLWITKYRHNKIVANYEKHVEDLREALNRKEIFEIILNKLVDKSNSFGDSLSVMNGCLSGGELILPNDVPRYVEDYFGGKVIKQEATPVIILDKKGKATYGMTAKSPDKGRLYKLVQK
jgi:hypothetical protein